VIPTYRLVDTCAAEFEAYTPYYYSTYGIENEMRRSAQRKIMILGGGPNRIGQGIEFDYCCVHAAFALRELGIETIMVNSNPETVSTDYDTSDKLYFEPLTHEDVLNIYEQEKPEGVIVQFGGQTPLNLAAGLKAAGVRNRRASNWQKTENYLPKCSIDSACAKRQTVPRRAKRKRSKSRTESATRSS
jgi:carbamoyl-phosphate synthase large subunit